MMSHNWNVVQKLASIPKGAKTALAEVYKASKIFLALLPSQFFGLHLLKDSRPGKASWGLELIGVKLFGCLGA